MSTKVAASLWIGLALLLPARGYMAQLGVEVSVPTHLQNGEEHRMSIGELIDAGQRLFEAMWTAQEGGGRPLTKGTGGPIADPSNPLVFPRNFNRVSAPDSNSCSGCHNKPFVGGGGDIVSNVFVLGQRFDFATFDILDPLPTRGAVDEAGALTDLQRIADFRKTVGMNGSGFIEMLARQVTSDLRRIRDSLGSGGVAALSSKGISYGTLSRDLSGNWITSGVSGIPATSLVTTGPADPPSLIIRPFHQAGAVVSLREFTNNAFNHHHGIQSEERFGAGVDADGDGFVNELTIADVTAATLFQATMNVPGRVIPRDPLVESAVVNGERKFAEIGCEGCHRAVLPLVDQGWVFTEPNPFNPPGNLNAGPALEVDLTSQQLPRPRLTEVNGVVWVPAYTDLKLHDLTTGPNDPDREPLDMLQPAGSPEFFAGNSKFITRKLWGIANQHSFGHHGQYSTMREAIHAHNGEALATRAAFLALSPYDRDSVIEFLKSLQILPPGTNALCVDERLSPRTCPTGVSSPMGRGAGRPG
jgi:Di-haem oxidoreductase, putative peroxidase